VLRFQADGEYEVRSDGLKHQKEKRSMDHFAGLDVSVKETSVCIVDDTGKIVREVKVASEPEALLAVLKNPGYHFKRIGLEAGPLSQWLFSALAEAELLPIELRGVPDNGQHATMQNADLFAQRPQLLAAECLHMHWSIKPHPHHLRDTAGIVAVRLVDLCLQYRPHMPRLNTDHRQVGFGKRTEQPLRQRSSFQSDPLEVIGSIPQNPDCFPVSHRYTVSPGLISERYWFANHVSTDDSRSEPGRSYESGLHWKIQAVMAIPCTPSRLLQLKSCTDEAPRISTPYTVSLALLHSPFRNPDKPSKQIL
jgi:hypothetical protein